MVWIRIESYYSLPMLGRGRPDQMEPSRSSWNWASFSACSVSSFDLFSSILARFGLKYIFMMGCHWKYFSEIGWPWRWDARINQTMSEIEIWSGQFPFNLRIDQSMISAAVSFRSLVSWCTSKSPTFKRFPQKPMQKFSFQHCIPIITVLSWLQWLLMPG